MILLNAKLAFMVIIMIILLHTQFFLIYIDNLVIRFAIFISIFYIDYLTATLTAF